MLKLISNILFTILQISVVQNALLLKITSINCTTLEPNFIHAPLCELKAVRRGITELSLKIVFHQLPIDNVTLHFGHKKRNAHNLLSEFTIDCCAFMVNKRRNPIAQLLYNAIDLQKYSNMNHSCPYNHNIIFNKYRLNMNNLIFYPYPDGHYFAYSEWYFHNVRRFIFSATYEASRK